MPPFASGNAAGRFRRRSVTVIGRSSAGVARSDRVDDGRVPDNPSPTALSGGRQSLEAERRPDMSLGIQPKSAWPEALRHPEVRGVFIGGCVERGVGSSFRAKAQAHTHGARRGWVCFRSARWLGCRALLLHELAHVVTREGHTRSDRRNARRGARRPRELPSSAAHRAATRD